MKSRTLVLIAVIASAFLIRASSIFANLPYVYWLDETSYIENALRFGSGNLSLITFSHGALYPVFLFFEYAVLFLLMKLFGMAASATNFYIMYLKDPTALFVLARATTVLLGTGTVYMIYLVARKIYDEETGLIAAVFAGFSLMMVQTSALALADIPALFLELASFLVLLRYLEKDGSTRTYFVSAALTGLAAACKYYTVFGIVPVFMAAFYKMRDDRRGAKYLLKMIGLAVVFMIAGFIIGEPFLLADFGKFFRDTYIRLGDVYMRWNTSDNTWLFYFTHHLKNGLGLPLELVILAGLAHSLFRRTRYDLMLASVPVTFYLFIMSSVGFAYHFLPALPFLIILGARLLRVTASRIFAGRAIYASFILALVVVYPTLADSIKFEFIMNGADTRSEAKDWIEKNVPAGSKILSDGYIYGVPVHTTPIVGNEATLKRDMDSLAASGGAGFGMRIKAENFERLYSGDRAYDIFKDDLLTKDDVASIDPRYVILTSAQDVPIGEELAYCVDSAYHSRQRALRDFVSQRYELMKSFIPTREFTAAFPHLMDQDYRIIRGARPADLGRFSKGPRIDIYRKKGGR